MKDRSSPTLVLGTPKKHCDDLLVDQAVIHPSKCIAVCSPLAPKPLAPLTNSMSPELLKQHEHMDAYAIVYHLRELFDEQTRLEWFDVSRLLFRS
ncbi:hypothetical protein ZIOFF_039439 [Zingiber officinale]|uniref:Uncharacterized protein n=1 Tax=Zingiber officinale TaxID=94328 RepID=A0A8J5G739_ZINOF|nr:hypothetical protein ZIOFF_039439 [Zingiber officinale]